MDVFDKLFNRINWKFPKGYPDVNDPKDMELLKEFLKEYDLDLEILNEDSNSRYGYHIGDFDKAAESLEDRNWYFNNKTGYLGTGFYFYGDKENAEEDAAFLNISKKKDVHTIDLSQYKLFKPQNPENFYDTLVSLTQQVGKAAPKISDEVLDSEDFEETLDEIADVVKTDLGLPLQRETVHNIIKGFIKDVRDENNGTLLSNRLLTASGYEGIDNLDTPLDHFGVGSVLFKVKDSSYQKVDI